MTTGLDEAALIDRSVNGDQAALERLMLNYHHRLTAELGRRLPDSVRGFVTIEDVLQETYVIVFREIGVFRPRGPGAFYGWIETIAENRLYDAIRAERAKKRDAGRKSTDPPANVTGGSVVEMIELLASHERTPSRSAAVAEAVEALRAAMEVLPPDYNTVLRLRYMEGLSVSEAAARMNRSDGAICLLCHRALQQLQAMLGSSSLYFSSSA